MESIPQMQKPGLPQGPHRKRLKISIACQSCRSKKTKCDGIRPACSNCQKKDNLRRNCTYIAAGDRVSDVPSPSLPDPAVAVESHQFRVGEEVSRDRHPAADSYYIGSPGVFAGEVKAAIDARLGNPSDGRPSSTPMKDAPLFGLVHRHQHAQSLHDVENVLPPRKHADHLTNIYWRYIQPLEPILDKERFTESYQSLFAGSLLDDEDERIFLSSLNTVFALATQLQENLQAEQRDAASNTYFQRAWTLLHSETILWGPGSLEVVQCLLLMSRYLQCTNNPHQTWMAVGSAVRIAQSLGFDMAGGPTFGSSLAENNLRRQLWQCCVFMDRGISWGLGRASTAILSIHPTRCDSQWLGMEDQNCGPYDCYFTKTLELYEIANHTMLSQMPSGSSLGAHLGLPQLYQDNNLSTVVDIDACLSKWEDSLPAFLKLEHGNADEFSYRQSVILRFRLLHGRIVLFRPILARFCLSQSTALNMPLGQCLEDKLLQSSASICISSAEKMINLVHANHNPDGTIGAVPWWHRIFYLHIAGTILIASMMRDDLFTATVAQSWSKAMSTLRAHEHLSPFIQQCVTNFEALSSKISETHDSYGGTHPSVPDRSSGTYFQDVFQDIGFDPDNFLFGKEDMAWLSNFETIQ